MKKKKEILTYCCECVSVFFFKFLNKLEQPWKFTKCHKIKGKNFSNNLTF